MVNAHWSILCVLRLCQKNIYMHLLGTTDFLSHRLLVAWFPNSRIKCVSNSKFSKNVYLHAYILFVGHCLISCFFHRLIVAWFPTCPRSSSYLAVSRLLWAARTTFSRYVCQWLTAKHLNTNLDTIKINVQRYCSVFVAGNSARQDDLLEWIYGHRHSTAERTSLDPRRRLHRTFLHRVRHAEWSRWLCWSKIMTATLDPHRHRSSQTSFINSVVRNQTVSISLFFTCPNNNITFQTTLLWR